MLLIYIQLSWYYIYKKISIWCCFWSWHPDDYYLTIYENLRLWPDPCMVTQHYQDQLAPVFTTIVNASLSCAEFPTEIKKAFCAPLLKKIILDVKF